MAHLTFESKTLHDLPMHVAALIIGTVFWLGSVIFLLLNLFLIPWHRLWRVFGVWNLVALRFIMRMRNLHDTSPRDVHDRPSSAWKPEYRYQRTADGSFNDLGCPMKGAAGTRFARNFALTRLRVDEANLLNPNPRDISRELLTRDRFRPATSLNVLAAAWIQFQVHDWVNHLRGTQTVCVPLKKGDAWPPSLETSAHPEAETNRTPQNEMKIRRSLPDERRTGDPEHPPLFTNNETHWWDGSQLYGSGQRRQDDLREGKGGRLKLVKEGDYWRLPPETDRELPGVDLTGFNQNWWVGLSLLHTLFALEHNAICDSLAEAYTHWDDERLFQTARLINAALLAKIHTVEWTPAILGHPTLLVGMRANWQGISLLKRIGRSPLLRGLQEELSGIPGSAQDDHAAPYYLTEEFVSVYRMHPLIPDDYRFYSLATDEVLEERTFTDIQTNKTRKLMDRVKLDDLLYSFGVAYPGALTLHNFPRTLQHFHRVKDEHGPPGGEFLDLGAIDVFRDRERAVPRYNRFRSQLLLLPACSYRRLVGLPLLPWLSRLSRREIEDRKRCIQDLKTHYPDKKLLDLMVGLYAEDKPKGFGFSDTAFRIFILMASRRLKSDRFFTEDLKAEVYTDIGLNWICDNNMKSILLRHYPKLAASLAGVENPFTPWPRAERPLVDPAPVTPFRFSTLPIAAGAVTGVTAGFFKHLHDTWNTTPLSVATPINAICSSDAWWGGAIGGVLAGGAVSMLHLVSCAFDRKWSGSGKAALVYLAAVTVAIVRAGIVTWQAGSPLFAGTFHKLANWDETLRVAALGGLVGLAILGAVKLWAMSKATNDEKTFGEHLRARMMWGVIGGVAGLMVGALIHLNGQGSSNGLSSEHWANMLSSLVSTESLVAASLGAAIGLSSALVGAAFGAVLGWMVGMLVQASPILSDITLPNLWNAATSNPARVGAIVCAMAALVNRGMVPAVRGAVFGWLTGALLGFLYDEAVIGKLDGGMLGATTWRFVAIGAAVGIVGWLFYPRIQWAIRKRVWNLLVCLKFFFNKPLKIKRTRGSQPTLRPVPLQAVLPEIPLSGIMVAHTIPHDERSWSSTRYLMKALLFPLQRWLYRVFPPMQPGLPSLPSGAHVALERVYGGLRKRLHDAPELVCEYEGSPDLGRLATRSPYACYTSRVQHGEQAGDYEWNLRELDRYAVHPHLYHLGCRVLFRVVHDPADARPGPQDASLEAYRIDYLEEGKDMTAKPGDPNWLFAKKLALCAVSNHMSLVRHWNWVHLTPTAHLAMATRNHLSGGHPLGRLLWPHIFGTQQSNYFGTMAQVGPGGDFPEIFSFTFPAMCQLFADTYSSYDFSITDPYLDRRKRGLDSPGFPTPSQDNLEELFDVLHDHTTRFVKVYYDPHVSIQDQAVMEWLKELNGLIPNGTGVMPDRLSTAQLAQLLAQCIYLVTVQHEMVGSQLWNYQLWTHRQPVRLYKNRAREPEDVYERLVNMNFLLHVKRTRLMDDYSFLAEGLPRQEEAAKCFRQFKQSLEDLDRRMRDRAVWAPWIIYPKDLEAHINA